MRSNRALWTLIKDNASYELTRACGKLCRIPCLKSTFAASKCLFCGLQSTTNSGLQSTEHGDDLHQDRGRLTRGSGLLPLASHLDRWLAMHTCIGYKIPKLLLLLRRTHSSITIDLNAGETEYVGQPEVVRRRRFKLTPTTTFGG